jgi:hypothetical protein
LCQKVESRWGPAVALNQLFILVTENRWRPPRTKMSSPKKTDFEQQISLVGGLEHVLFCHILGIISGERSPTLSWF